MAQRKKNYSKWKGKCRTFQVAIVHLLVPLRSVCVTVLVTFPQMANWCLVSAVQPGITYAPVVGCRQ